MKECRVRMSKSTRLMTVWKREIGGKREVAMILKIWRRSSSGRRDSCGPRWVTAAGMMVSGIEAGVEVVG